MAITENHSARHAGAGVHCSQRLVQLSLGLRDKKREGQTRHNHSSLNL